MQGARVGMCEGHGCVNEVSLKGRRDRVSSEMRREVLGDKQGNTAFGFEVWECIGSCGWRDRRCGRAGEEGVVSRTSKGRSQVTNKLV